MLTWLLAGLALIAPSDAAISRAEIERHMNILCAPEWEGRMTLEPGNVASGKFLADEFKRFGLEPRHHEGFIHNFEITVNQRPTDQNMFVIEGNGKRMSLTLGQDYRPLVGTSGPRLVRAGLAWVGYGIKRDTWNDYAGIDVKGKVVLALRGEPQGAERATNAQKARWASEQGAVGIVFAGPQDAGYAELPRPSRVVGIPQSLNMIGAGIHRRLLPDLIGKTWEQARAMTAPASRELPFIVRAVTQMEPNKGTSFNVIGFLPGNDPKLKNEYIIVGAHFDHLGWGEWASRTGNELPHYGADDNASGVVGVLALAESFAQTRSNRRTIVFQLYSGEEVGLVGAFAWVRDNPEIVKNTKLMINLDMIGRLRDDVTVFGTASAPELRPLLDKIQIPGLKISPVPTVAPNSDHFPFARAGVPVMFWHTGLHDEYHTERDTVATLNFDGIVKVTEATRDAINLTDAGDDRFTFNADSVQPRREATTRRVRAGFQPDMGASGPGVRLRGVSPDTPAARAGLREGDRILEIGGTAITDLDALQGVLARLNPGQKVKVVFERGGQRMEVEMTLDPTQGEPPPVA